MRERAKRNFIVHQGFEEPAQTVCDRQYSALLFKGRIVFVWVVGGILFQSSPLFYALCAVLWWSALLPALRRTAQAMAGAFALACGLLIHFGFSTAAYVVEGMFLAAVLALTLGGLCVGSFVYHLLRGKGSVRPPNPALGLQNEGGANVYYLEATLTRSAAGGNSRVGIDQHCEDSGALGRHR